MSIRSVVAAAAVLAAVSSARATVLYDGSVDASPTVHGLVYGAVPIATYYAVGGGATTLDTLTANSIYAGFGENAIALNRSMGYTIRVDAQVLGESRASDDRAGFSVIAISSDLRGIELGFQPTRVFAQSDSPLFTAAEATSGFDPSAAHSYALSVLANTYTLRAEGTTILSGALRDYSAFAGLFGGTVNPYRVPNSFFLGDDTTSAGADARFSYVSVPEPAMIGTVACLGCVSRRRRSTREQARG